MANNQFVDLPLQLCSIHSLEFLDMSDNQLKVSMSGRAVRATLCGDYLGLAGQAAARQDWRFGILEYSNALQNNNHGHLESPYPAAQSAEQTWRLEPLNKQNALQEERGNNPFLKIIAL